MRIINTRKAEVIGLLMLIVGLALALQLCSHPVAAQDKPSKPAQVVEGKLKSYPLPEALATQIEKLAQARDNAYLTFLNHVFNSKLYQSEDSALRLSVFDRQQRLLEQYQESINNMDKWILNQRKEFKCDLCDAKRTPDGKWTFAEPNPEGTK